MVELQTSMGRITLKLDADKAPKTVENFLTYVRDGHFDGTIFHRVINGFMIQGGGFDAKMSQKPTRDTIENEANNGLLNKAYTVAMARTSDPHSASAQFFINLADNEFLNFKSPSGNGWGYAVFGEVIGIHMRDDCMVVDGRDIVDQIKAVKTNNSGPHQDVPVEAVTITKASVID